MPYSPILATLGYIFSQDRTHVLMCHRNARPDDAHYGKWNGIGGKLEPGEDIVSGFQREVREETGLECPAVQLAGTISWPGFGKQGEAWFGFIFRVFKYTGTLREHNEEGSLHWVPLEELLNLPMWEGDRQFVPLVLKWQSPQFHGVMPYKQGKMVNWEWKKSDS